MSQSGDSLAQKSGTFPDRQNPRALYSCRSLMPPSPQLQVHGPLTPKCCDCGTKAEALAKEDGEGGSGFTDGPGYRPHRTNLKDNILRSGSAEPSSVITIEYPPSRRAFVIPPAASRNFPRWKISENFGQKISEKNNERK